ncbi:MAG: hypothetical protein JNM93_01410 [Bacteriovoracaceae bacterium]|nr:hypothetical protein [Bacteriovoracaceae bacterium]
MGESDLELVLDLKKVGYTQIQAEEMIKVLDKKMKHDFATKNDLKDLKHAMDLRFEAVNLRFEKLESSISLKFEQQENHLIQKMGIMLTAGLTLTVSVLSLILKN